MAQLNFTVVRTLHPGSCGSHIPGQNLVQAKALDPCTGKSESWVISFLQNPHSPHSLCNSRKFVYQKPSPKVWNKSKRNICHHMKTLITLCSLRTGLSELWTYGKQFENVFLSTRAISWLSWGNTLESLNCLLYVFMSLLLFVYLHQEMGWESLPRRAQQSALL